jgi:FkbM family methyltransferase
MSSSSPSDIRQVFQQFQQQLLRIDKQLLKTRQAVAGLSAESLLRSRGQQPVMPVEFNSQFGEDLLAWELFKNQPKGFFIEAGALDGYHHSVTYAFEAIGWQGLLVEPTPARYAQCAERRTRSQVVHAALGHHDASGQTAFWVVEDRFGGALSYSKPTDDHLVAIGNVPRQQVMVPSVSLNELLTSHTGPIDLFVLDVEGAELDVLDGFDLNRFKPRVMIIEDNSRPRSTALPDYIKQFPYTLVARLAVNDVYIRSDEVDLFERFKWSQQ